MTTQSMIFDNETIHVKLQFNGEYRRFFVSKDSKFSDLVSKIKAILQIDTDIVVKYQDEEEEWITISSDAELETGIIVSNGTILRLQCLAKDNSLPQLVNNSNNVENTQECSLPEQTRWRKNREGGYRGGRYRGKGRRDRRDRGDDRDDRDDITEDNDREHKGGEYWKNKYAKKDNKKEWKNEKKEWKNEKKNERRQRKKRYQEENEKPRSSSSSSSSSDDPNCDVALLSVDEIKNQITQLKETEVTLKDKCRVCRESVKEVKAQIKALKESNEDIPKELKEDQKQKNKVKKSYNQQLKVIRSRLAKLREVADTKQPETSTTN